MENATGKAWIKIAVIYFTFGILLGLHMAKSGDFSMRPVHAHLNLLGWVSMALFGLIYCQFPQLANNGLAKAHLWIYNLAFPVQMTTLYIYLGGNADIEPVLGMASMAVGFSVLLFVINVLKNLK